MQCYPPYLALTALGCVAALLGRLPEKVLTSYGLHFLIARIARPVFQKVYNLGYFVTAIDQEPRQVRGKKV